jgi:hypothetical protein
MSDPKNLDMDENRRLFLKRLAGLSVSVAFSQQRRVLEMRKEEVKPKPSVGATPIEIPGGDGPAFSADEIRALKGSDKAAAMAFNEALETKNSRQVLAKYGHQLNTRDREILQKLSPNDLASLNEITRKLRPQLRRNVAGHSGYIFW